LTLLLQSPHEPLRIGVAQTLGQIGPPAGPALLRALTDPGRYVRREAVWALRRLNWPSPLAVAALAAVLSDADDKVRRGAALALGDLGPLAAAAVPALVAALPLRSLVFRRLVRWALGRIGAPAVPVLTEALSSGDFCLRREAAEVLQEIRQQGQEKVSTLVLLLGGPPVHPAN
jgi:HEAT repeat protein